jgi:diguanylate cyclase (GGDEF)-like protein
MIAAFVARYAQSVDLVFDSEQRGVPVYKSGVEVARLLSEGPDQALGLLAGTLGILFDVQAEERDLYDEICRRMFDTQGTASEHGEILELCPEQAARLAMVASTDPLTGLLNRRGAEVKVSAMLSTDAMPVSVLVVDVDHFKKVNDTMGHAVGDEILKALGNTLTRGRRRSDFVVRWGGEEFVVVMPNCDQEAATGIAEAIRCAVEIDSDTVWPASITVSIGVATASVVDEAELKSLVARADVALYEAKVGGRNLVVVQTESDGTLARAC